MKARLVERPSRYKDDDRCVARVNYNRECYGRCANQRGKGPDGLYCWIHARILSRQKEKEITVDWTAKLAEFLGELTGLIKDVRVIVQEVRVHHNKEAEEDDDN